MTTSAFDLLEVGAPRTRETPKPDAARAQEATNGSPHPRVLNPGPLPLGPGIETRHTRRRRKAADVEVNR